MSPTLPSIAELPSPLMGPGEKGTEARDVVGVSELPSPQTLQDEKGIGSQDTDSKEGGKGGRKSGVVQFAELPSPQRLQAGEKEIGSRHGVLKEGGRERGEVIGF